MTREQLRQLIREVIAESLADMKQELERGVVKEMNQSSTNAPPQEMAVTEGMLTEKILQTAVSQQITSISVAPSVIVTPLARDAARRKGIRLTRSN